jgi:signal transduction histidine kinase
MVHCNNRAADARLAAAAGAGMSDNPPMHSPTLGLAAPPRAAGPPLSIVAAYVACYVALDWVSYIQPVGAFPITPWNPPPGLSVAFLLRFGARQGPWLFVAATLAEVLVRGLARPGWMLLATAALPALAYSGAAAVLASRHAAGTHSPASPPPIETLASLRSMARFLVVVLVATGVVALSLVALYRTAGLLQGNLAEAVAQSWIGDFVGIAVTTPALLLIAQRPWPLAWRSVLAPLAAIGAAFWLVFGSGLANEARLFYVLFLPLVWIAVQHGLRAVALAIVAVQVALVAEMRSVPGALLDFQFLMLALCVTGLLLGAAVTERRTIEAALRDKQQALDRSLRMAAASELASALAHELQQPLTASRNYLRAAALIAEREGRNADEWQATVAKALGESERAVEVVRRLRDFFRGGMVQLEPVDARALVQPAVDAVRERAARAGVRLRVALPAESVPVSVDRLQIETVLANLLGNALDAVEPGGQDEREPREIVVEVEREAAGARISVIDNGPGVPVETAARLFEHFATSKPSGLGLGLAISRSIVEAHGGRIVHEALPGRTAFRFFLPRA